MTAMAKVQEEAESKGLEIPPVFSDLDDDSGLPKILSIERKSSNIEVERVVQHADQGLMVVPPSPPPLPTVVFYDSDTQTDDPILSEKSEQTESAEMCDSGIGTELRFADYTSEAIQCGGEWATINDEVQTVIIETSDNEMMTYCEPSSESAVQTDNVHTKEQELQTHLVDYLESETQSEILTFECRSMQTPIIEYSDQEMQTDDMETSKPRHRRRLHTWNRDHRKSLDPSIRTGFAEEDNDSSSSNESLDWNPIDGMHAEKQRPVRDLAQFFDKIRTEKSTKK